MTRSLIRDAGAGLAHDQLVDAAQHGDAGAQEELVRRFEPLVQRVVWKLRLPPGCERDDLAQEARVGLLSAIRAWRPARGPFPAFADRCVSNQALLALKATAARKHQILSLAASLDAPSDRSGQSDERQPQPLLDTLAARRDARTDPELRLLVNEQLTSRTARPSGVDRERARWAHDGPERREPDASRRHAAGLAACGIAGGAPRPAQARHGARARRVTGADDDLRPVVRRAQSLAAISGQRPGGWRSTNPPGPVPTVLHRGPVPGGLGGLPSPAAVSR